MSEICGGSNDGMDMGGGPEVSSSGETSGRDGGPSETDGETGSEISGNGREVGSAERGMGFAHEIPVLSGETTAGRSQILETPASPELGRDRELVESFHRQSIDQILEYNGKYMTEADRERVAAGVDQIRVVDYDPDRGRTGGYGFYQGRSHMEVSRISEQQMERSTKHETNHFASKHREIIVPEPDRHGYTVYKTVGTWQSCWFHSTRTGAETGHAETGRGMNEGLTTLFTNRQLMEINKEKGEAAEREQIYSRTVEICHQLENIVGEEVLKEAYYGGNQQRLEAQVNALAGEQEYRRLRDCLDRTLSWNHGESVAAMREAQEILAKMSDRRQV